MEQWKEYKETEFGKIPNSWDVATIKEETKVVVDYVANGSFASLAENVKYKTEEDYAVLIRLVDYKNNYNGNFVFIDKEAYELLGKSKLFGDEIIISNVGANVGTVFKCPRLKYKMSLAPNSIMVKFKGNNDFYYYWLKSPFGQHMLHSIVTGSAQPKFNKTNFREMSIPVPPIEIQEKIAQLLKPLDEKIEVNKQINSNLEEQAKALFKSWFIDFEPFKGGKFIDSELGMIPEGWNVKSASDIFNITIGKTPPRKESKWFTKGIGNVWVSISDMKLNGAFIGHSSEKLSDDAIAKFNIVMVPKDTILLSFKLTIGRVAISSCDLTTNEAIARFSIDNPRLREFTYLFLKNYNYQSLGSTSSIATAVNSKIIKSMPFLLPDADTTESFHKLSKPLFDQIEVTQKQTDCLAFIRDTLLPKLMSGEIDVEHSKLLFI